MARQPAQAFSVSLPLVVDDTRYPSVLVETTISDVQRISPTGLSASIGSLINEETQDALLALDPDLIPVEQLAQMGLSLSLNPQSLTLELDIALERRAASTTSLARDWVIWGDEVIEPSGFAFGVTGAAILNDSVTDSRGTSGDLSLDGFVNFGGSHGVSIDWGGRYTFSSAGEESLRRDRILAFVDRPGTAERFSAGDLAPQLARNQGVLNLLGLAYETNYRALQPTRNIRPTGDRSLLLERPSTVEVYVNGALVDRFAAGPGPIDLRDIPLANTSNTVTIMVEDDLGRHEVDTFSLSANIALLAPGLDEMVWAAGFARDANANGFSYDFNRPVLGGVWTRGINSSLTVTGGVAVTTDVHSLSGAAAWPVWGGVMQGELTVSDGTVSQPDSAIALAFSGGPYWPETHYTTLNLRLEYYGEDFADLGDPTSLSDTRWSLGGDARVNLTERLSVTAGAQYQDAHSSGSRSASLFTGVNRRFGEIIASATLRHTYYEARDDDTGLFLTLSRRFGGRNYASYSHDSLTGTSRFDVRRSRGGGIPNLQARASAVHRDSETDWLTSVGIETSRLGLQLDGAYTPETANVDERATLGLRLQSGLAYADGQWGLGRDPGRGFVMIDRHATLADSDVRISTGASTTLLAQVDEFGPAVVRTEAPFRPLPLRVDAPGAPPGYDIGPGRYTILPGSLTGTRIIVGTEAFRTAVATLLLDDGPAQLEFGLLHNLETGTSQAFFTNRTGRAAFNALLPGEYEARLDSRPGQRFRFAVPADSEAYINLGELTAERQP
ncbi:fimbria/pilus outer membrane usher protein [Maricaulis parjimensis]|uniref:fimbria/pilus outer membrane usher protein n=1 Tax=Maricaulis parjimensis TaxID=144023 RepID=UPI0019399C43|nr:fimbria/pilus outer membrane usher protein [Maricaulis parjimensis]